MKMGNDCPYDVQVLMKLRERKVENLKKIRFQATGSFATSHPMTLVFSEVLGNTRKFIHESKTSYKMGSRHNFNVIEMNSDVFEGDILLTRVLHVEAFELSIDKRGNRSK